MVLIAKNGLSLIITTGEKLFLKKPTETTELTLPPPIPAEEKPKVEKKDAEITCLCISKNNEHFATCSLDKQLLVFTADGEILRNTTLVRAASNIRFIQGQDLLIADKTGDLYVYNFEKNSLELLLGHLSMLLDVLLTDCEKYVITCDRDEKIRVSNYPKCYDIESYCLGHTEYVCCVEQIGPSTIVSASGDGTVRFWNFVNGKQMFCLEVAEFLDQKDVEKLREQLKGEELEGDVIPITSLKVSPKRDRIVVSLYQLNKLLLFSLSNVDEIKCIFMHILSCESEMYAFDVKDSVIVLYKDNVREYDLNNLQETKKIEIPEIGCDKWSDRGVSTLFKRKYDNVKEYNDRKKLRMEAKAKC